MNPVEMYCYECKCVRNVNSILFGIDEIRISCSVCFHYTYYEIKKKELDSLGRKID